MSDEPRIRLEDSGTVVSEYWYDQSTGETVVESESGETYRFTDDGTLDTPAVNTDEVGSNDLHADFRYYEDESGTVHAIGPDGEVDSGTAQSVLQSTMNNNPKSTHAICGVIGVSDTISVNLGSASGFKLICRGRIRVDASGIGQVLQITNGRFVTLDLYFDGNAKGNYSYAKDFSYNVSGIDTLLYLRGVRNVFPRMVVEEYNGRAVEIDTEDSGAGEPKTSHFEWQGMLADCAQAAHIDCSNAFGILDQWFVDESDAGTYINTNDLSLGHWENYMGDATEPMIITNTDAVHISQILLAGGVNPHLEMSSCRRVELKQGFITGQGDGIGAQFIDCDYVDANLHTALNKAGYGLEIDGCRRSHIIHRSESDLRSTRFTSTNRNNRDLDVTVLSWEADQRGINIESTANGNTKEVTLFGSVRDANQSGAAGESEIVVDADSHDVQLVGMNMTGNNTAYRVDAPAGNNIDMIGGSLKGSSPKLNNMLWRVDSVQGFRKANLANWTAREGVEMYHDGNDGSAVGPYVGDGTSWHGYGPASGSSI